MTDESQQPIVIVRRQHSRRCTECCDEGLQLLERGSAAVRGGSKKPRAPGKKIRTRVCNPASSGAAEWMTADEGKSVRQRRRGFDDRPFRTASICHDRGAHDVVWQRFEDLQILLNRRGENDEVGVGQHDRIVGRDIDGMKDHRPLEHILLIDADDEPGGPGLSSRERNRSAYQPQTDDADPLKDWRLPLVPARLQHW